VLILTITGLFFLERAKTEGPRVVVGEVGDFPVGSVTRMELRVHVPDPHPEIAERFLDGEGDLPIFMVNHPDFGILALSLYDLHLGIGSFSLANLLRTSEGRFQPISRLRIRAMARNTTSPELTSPGLHHEAWTGIE